MKSYTGGTCSVSPSLKPNLYFSYLMTGPDVSLNVALLSEKMVVEKVVSNTLPTPGGQNLPLLFCMWTPTIRNASKMLALIGVKIVCGEI